jgi:hypothetical protein
MTETEEPMSGYGDDNDYNPEDESAYGHRIQFANPGSNSALRASSRSNPRNLPCPTCKKPNRITPADRARHYQCDECADMAEGGGGY